MIRKWHIQKEIPTPKTKAGKKINKNLYGENMVSRRKTYRKPSEGIHCQQFLLHSQILNNLISFYSNTKHANI